MGVASDGVRSLPTDRTPPLSRPKAPGRGWADKLLRVCCPTPTLCIAACTGLGPRGAGVLVVRAKFLGRWVAASRVVASSRTPRPVQVGVQMEGIEMARGWKSCKQHRRYNHECGGCIGLNITRFKSCKAAENKALQAGTVVEPIDSFADAVRAFNNELASVIMDVAIEQMGRADQLQHAAALLRGECEA